MDRRELHRQSLSLSIGFFGLFDATEFDQCLAPRLFCVRIRAWFFRMAGLFTTEPFDQN